MTGEHPCGFVGITGTSTLQVSRWPGKVLLCAGLCTQALTSGDIVLKCVFDFPGLAHSEMSVGLSKVGVFAEAWLG